MYIPISYWQTEVGNPHMVANFFSTPTQGVPGTITFTYDGVALTESTSVVLQIEPVCLDVTGMESLIEVPVIAGTPYFCSAGFSGSNQCCINYPPNTGPEAWYMDVSYRMISDYGPYYWSYVNERGEIINDTISFGQTKRIISQTSPTFLRANTGGFGYNNWTIVGKFPGQVIPYPYKDIPTTYTFQLKKDRAITNPGLYIWNTTRYVSASVDINGFPQTSTTAVSLINTATQSFNATRSIVSSNIPLDNNDQNLSPGVSWIISAVPLPKGAHRLQSCSTTHSLWVTLNDYTKYQTGSVLQVSNPQLTSTSSCWSVTALSSSVSVSVSLDNVNVVNTYSTCNLCLSASI